MADTLTSLTLDAEVARAGPAAESFARLWRSLWQQGHVPVEMLELCRLTFARMHDDAAEMAAANSLLAETVSQNRRKAVLAGEALDDLAFTPAEKATLLFAEYYWIDPQSITDEVAEAVKVHVGDAGLVFLIEALGCIDGRIRTARCLRDIAAHVPAKEFAHVG